jgi:hypothetical protein
VTRTLLNGILTFIAAFAIWNVDNICCDSLRRAREALSPLGFLLEGHAYWHFGTGYGAFLIITAVLCGYLICGQVVNADVQMCSSRPRSRPKRMYSTRMAGSRSSGRLD